jgi:hypothetical protein
LVDWCRSSGNEKARKDGRISYDELSFEIYPVMMVAGRAAPIIDERPSYGLHLTILRYRHGRALEPSKAEGERLIRDGRDEVEAESVDEDLLVRQDLLEPLFKLLHSPHTHHAPSREARSRRGGGEARRKEGRRETNGAIFHVDGRVVWLTVRVLVELGEYHGDDLL